MIRGVILQSLSKTFPPYASWIVFPVEGCLVLKKLDSKYFMFSGLMHYYRDMYNIFHLFSPVHENPKQKTTEH